MKGPSSPDTVSAVVDSSTHGSGGVSARSVRTNAGISRILAYERPLTPGFVSTTVLYEFDFSVCRSDLFIVKPCHQ